MAAAILGLYWKFLDGYLWDDDFSLIVSGLSVDLDESFRILNRHHFYRPLIELYFDFAMALFGYAPRAFHALNIGLHVVNASLAFLIARRVLRTTNGAFTAALLFAVLPAILDTIAWVSAVTALLMTTCFLTAMLAHIAWLDSGRRTARAVSVIAFVAALLAHEGAVTLLPMLMLAEYLIPAATAPPSAFAAVRKTRLRELPRRYGLFAVVLGCYLTMSFVINRTNYVVTEGHYRIGVHGLSNVLDYVSSLYVGRRGAFGWINAAALAAVMWFGTNRARFAAAWMLVALVPYSFFTWSGSGRYAYLAAVGFAMLLAAVLQSLHGALRPRLGAIPAAALTGVLVALIAGRFIVFASRGSSGALAPGEPYRMWLQSFRQSHASLPEGAVLVIDEPDDRAVNVPALTDMLRLEYNDPKLRVKVQ